MYEKVYQQILKVKLPQATERVAIMLLNLAASLAGQISLPMTEFLELCDIRNKRAAIRHLTRLKQMGIIHYRTTTNPAQVSVRFRSWIPEVEVEEKVEDEVEVEMGGSGAVGVEMGPDQPVAPQANEQMLEMAMALLNTTQLLLQSTGALGNVPTVELPQPSIPVAPPAPDPTPDLVPNLTSDLVSKTTKTGKQVVVEVDAQNLVNNSDKIDPIRVPLGNATLVIQMNLEPLEEDAPEDEPQSSPTPQKPKTTAKKSRSTRPAMPTYPPRMPTVLHRPAETDLGDSGETRRAKQEEIEEEALIYIKNTNSTDIQYLKNNEQSEERAQDVPPHTVETPSEPLFSAEEQERTFALLTDPAVGIHKHVARGMAQEHSFEWIRRQIFAWLEDIRIGKMHNTGALVHRINNEFYARELTAEDQNSALYRRHPSPFEEGVAGMAEVEIKAEVEVEGKDETEIEARVVAAFEEKVKSEVAVEGKVEEAMEVKAKVDFEAKVEQPDLTIWPQFLTEMQMILPTATFDSFLATSQLTTIEPDGTYVVQVETDYHRGYLEQRLRGITKRTLAGLLGQSSVNVRFESPQKTHNLTKITGPTGFIPSGQDRSRFRGRLRENVSKL